MADELDLDLADSASEEQEQISKAEKRIKSLSEKVKLTSQERDELASAKEKVEAEKAQALKDVDFFKNFNTLTSKYPGSSEFQDKIKEKFNQGYELEDATISELVKAGRFTPPTPEVARKESPAGGSASNTVRSGGEKPLSEMTQAERRKLLEDSLQVT